MAEPTTAPTDTGTDGTARSGASRLVSATALMAAGTAFSRVLGFVKASLIVAALGATTRQGEMFAIANVIPQAIYLLLAGGVLNTVFVPQIVRAMKENPDGGEAYTNRLLTLGLAAIGLIAIGATVLAPIIMGDVYLNSRWKAPGLTAQYDSVIMLSYLCLPQIFFYGMNVMLGQVLNARGRFGPMMWSPIANNLIGIASIVLFLLLWHGERDLGAPFTLGQELVLGLGATLGIIAQALVLIPFMRSVGYRFRPRFDFRNSGLGRAAQVAKWTVGYMIVTQLALVVVTKLANGATAGGEGAGWNVYQNANLLFMLPHSLITVSLTTAMLPSTSRLVVAGDLAGARRETMQTMRLAVAALLPASVAFLALAFPITQVLFGHGANTDHWQPIAWTLMAFAVGLVPFTLQYVCLRAFYALEDTRTTFFVQILIAGVNVIVALALVVPFHRPNWVAPALALAYASAYVIGLGVSFRRLGRRLPGLSGADLGRHCLRVFLAVAPAGLLGYLIVVLFRLWSVALWPRVLALAAAGLVAVVVYLGLARLLQITEIEQILTTVVRRGRRRPSPGASEPGFPADDPAGRGGSASPAAAGSGSIGTGTAGAAAGGWVVTQAQGAAVGSSLTGGEDGESVVTPTQQIDQPTGQQQMSGGHSHDRSEDEPASTPAAEEHETERTAAFSLAELEDDDTVTRPAIRDPERAPAGNGPVQPAEAADTPPDGIGPAQLSAGTMLAGRYRLEELLAWTGASITWRAFDQVLSRSVVVHLLPHGDPRSADLLTAGRRAAGATDSRFLRVLDAVEEDGRTPDGTQIGTYVVSEYADGQSLQHLLAAAPLTGLESAWVIREVADALAGAHARGLYHRRLGPDMVIITPSGNIKIVGMLVEAALRPEEYTGRSWSDDDLEAADVTALGRLLYACLVARWPGESEYGLPAGPEAAGTAQDNGHPWLTPRQVRPGVSPTLDRICDQLLSPVPRQRAERIVTAAALVGELDRVLGSADATGDLERRLRHPQPRFLAEDAGPEASGYADPPPEPYALIERNGSIAAGTNNGAGPVSQPSPAEPATGEDRARSGPRRWVWVLVIVLLVLAAVATVLTARGLGPTARPRPDTGTHTTSAQSTPTPTAPQRLSIVGGQDFDPPPGNGQENPGEVKYAYDGDPSTRWRTLSYYGSPKLGNLKPGVGIVLDLGKPHTVGEVKVTLSGTGTDLQIRVPKGGPSAQPDRGSLKAWRTVGGANGAGHSADITLDSPTTTRYVLVFLTSLPAEGGNYRGGIWEVEVLS